MGIHVICLDVTTYQTGSGGLNIFCIKGMMAQRVAHRRRRVSGQGLLQTVPADTWTDDQPGQLPDPSPSAAPELRPPAPPVQCLVQHHHFWAVDIKHIG